MQNVVLGRDVGDTAGVNAEVQERLLLGAGMSGGAESAKVVYDRLGDERGVNVRAATA